MDTARIDGFSRGKSTISFNYLMHLYEINYNLFTNLITKNKKPLNNFFMFGSTSIRYELISSSKYTNIFKCYFEYKNTTHGNNCYSIKPHIIFILYKDAALLEAKSLNQSRFFSSDINEKLKINLKVFYWLKNIIKKSYKNH